MAIRVFISSTSQDLGEYRQAAIEICNQLKFVPIAMEFFSAMGEGATLGSKKKVDESNLYIGIFAHRYGYIETGYDRAVTEIEYDYAGERGLDRLCFRVEASYPWPPDAIDYEHKNDLDRFMAKIDRSVIRATFTTIDDFKTKLISALVDWLQRNPDKLQAHQVEISDIQAQIRTAPTRPSLIIGRQYDLDRLKGRLGISSNSSRRAITVIRGWPGVGKTTLAAAVANDSDVIQAFSDGILWASVGENPDLVKELRKWGQALGSEIDQNITLEDAMEHVRSILHAKNALLIIDDIWDIDQALPFCLGGEKCSTIITTRFGDIAREISRIPDDIYVLERLDDEFGLTLLAQICPTVVNKYPIESRELVDNLEGLPLILRVAGRLLENEYASGFDVLESFRDMSMEAALIQQKAPEDRFDPRTGTTPTIELLLRKSTDRLDIDTRERFAYLGAFAPKPATFDLDALKAVWDVSDPKATILKLVDRGLLEPIPTRGRFWMHAVLVMHAKVLLEDF